MGLSLLSLSPSKNKPQLWLSSVSLEWLLSVLGKNLRSRSNAHKSYLTSVRLKLKTRLIFLYNQTCPVFKENCVVVTQVAVFFAYSWNRVVDIFFLFFQKICASIFLALCPILKRFKPVLIAIFGHFEWNRFQSNWKFLQLSRSAEYA